MFQIKARLLYNKRIGNDYFRFALEAPCIAHKAIPGQFVNIKLTDAVEPFLRRPFSIHRVGNKNIEILYEVVGPGTEILSKKKPQEYLDVIGPLGTGFSYHLLLTDHRLPILVAGGMGVAPLIFLAEKLAEIKNQRAKIKIIVLIGTKTKKQILCENEFKKLGCDVKIATDDGSKGFKGKVTDLLRDFLRTTNDERRTTIYACGPHPMLKEIANISQKYNILAQISLEEHMACGIGVCLGCVVNTKNGYQRVCKEGPVFAADEIVWEDNGA
jgi:dihydroorotate dehydrogenase electron transfer subunit